MQRGGGGTIFWVKGLLSLGAIWGGDKNQDILVVLAAKVARGASAPRWWRHFGLACSCLPSTSNAQVVSLRNGARGLAAQKVVVQGHNFVWHGPFRTIRSRSGAPTKWRLRLAQLSLVVCLAFWLEAAAALHIFDARATSGRAPCSVLRALHWTCLPAAPLKVEAQPLDRLVGPKILLPSPGLSTATAASTAVCMPQHSTGSLSTSMTSWTPLGARQHHYKTCKVL